MYSIDLTRLLLIQSVILQVVRSIERNDDRPLLQEIFVPKNLNENQTIKLNCDLVQGKQPVTFEWYFNDEKLANNDRIKVRTGDDFSNLMIRSLSIDDNGDYYCIGSNQFGNYKRHASVYVNGVYLKKQTNF